MAKTKKEAKAKTSKAKTAKDSISAKQYGRNVVLIVDGEKYSRAFNTKEKRSDILLSVETYNAKPTKKLKDSILNTMIEFEKVKEAKNEEVKEAKKTLKKPTKVKKPTEVQLTQDEIVQLKELLKTNTYVQSRSSQSRGGEY